MAEPQVATPQTLPALVRAKYPGVYDDLSDAELDTKVRAKFPGVYDDLPKPASPRAAHSDATIGPAMPGTALPDWANEASNDHKVTIADLEEHPREALAQIGRNLKREVTDPRTWLSVAAMYFGPKLFNTAAPIVARAANAVGSSIAEGPIPAIRNADPDLVSIASPRAGAAIRVAQRLANALPTRESAPTVPGFDRYLPNTSTSTASAPPETSAAPSSTPPPAGPPAPAALEESPAPAAKFPWQKALNELAIQARRQGTTLTEPESQAAAGLMQTHGVSAAEAVKTVVALKSLPAGLSPEEATSYAALRAQGKPHNAAMAAIQQMRTLREKFGLPTGAQRDAAVTQRNATGRWPE